MAKFPIIENAALLGSSMDSLVAKMVANLTAKGVAVNTGMSLMQLIDSIVEVKYQPLPLSRRASRGIVPDLHETLTNLDTLLHEARVRFKLKLEVMGITGLTDSMTLNQYADKIVDISIAPQYDLHPTTLSIAPAGGYAEFYFNTPVALKVDFAISHSEFTLDRTSGKGPANFIIRASAGNNTTAELKTALITITLDNGKYPSQTIVVTQQVGSVSYTYTDIKNSGLYFYASGKCSQDMSRDYTNFGATLKTYWNGILTDSTYHSNSSPGHGIEMLTPSIGFMIYGKNLLVGNRLTEEGPIRSCAVRAVYTEVGKGTFYSEYATVSQEANDWYDKLLELSPGSASIDPSGGSVLFSTAVIRGWTSGSETLGGYGYGSLLGSSPGFSVSGFSVSAGSNSGDDRSISVYARYEAANLNSSYSTVYQDGIPIVKQECHIYSQMNPGQYSSTADVWSTPGAPDNVTVSYTYSYSSLYGEEHGDGIVSVYGSTRSTIYFDGDLYSFSITGVDPSDTVNASYTY